jgi:integrase
MESREPQFAGTARIVDPYISPQNDTRLSPNTWEKDRIERLEKEVNRLRAYILKIGHGIIRDIGSENEPRAHSPIFSEFVSQFCHLKSGILRPSTINRIYRPSFKAFERLLGDKPLAEYTIRDVEQFKKYRLERSFNKWGNNYPCSPTTVNIQFRSLKSAFNTAVKWQLIETNPFNRCAQIKIAERIPIFLSRDNFQHLLRNVKEGYLKHIFLFGALTGMRLNEIIHLKWDNIDIERQVIRVENSVGFTTKSGRGRTIPLNKLLLDLLISIRPQQAQSSFVFSRRGYRYSPGFISHRFKLYIRALGLNEALHFHSLRHTFASWLVQEGVSLYEIQKLLGHSDLKVTEVYSHVGVSELHLSVNKITLPTLS